MAEKKKLQISVNNQGKTLGNLGKITESHNNLCHSNSKKYHKLQQMVTPLPLYKKKKQFLSITGENTSFINVLKKSLIFIK